MKQRSTTCPSPIDIYILMLIPTTSLAAIGFAHFTVNVNVVRAAYYLMLLAGVAMFISELAQSRIRSAARQTSPRIHKLLMLYTVSIVSSTSIMALASPLFAWDALRHWGESGIIITQSMSGSIEAPNIWSHRHPPGLTATLGMQSLLFPSIGSFLSGPAVIWIVSVVSIATSIRLSASLSGVWTLPIAAGLLSIPFIENHIISWGYAGLPMTAALFSACIFFIYFERTSRLLFLLLALVCLCSVALFKNIGILYVVSTVVAALTAKFVSAAPGEAGGRRCEGRKFGRRFIAIAITVICAMLLGAFVLKTYEGHLIQTLGKRLVIDLPNIEIVTNLLFHSVLKNASYNVSFIVIGVATLIYFFIDWEQEERYGHAFLSLLSVMALALWFSSLATEYGLSRAVPARDTGGTRHLLTPVIISIGLSIKSIIAFKNRAVQAV
jgi:hypothetical protein